ncbi:ACP S-malonyltransferase [Alkalinema sp. FACHB-956]|uniref:ACP S-malonyltransferase n=1 Tax=Alkalinema sp. FACHB-956 TaxID=2692768 RepID=UPI00168A2AFE|nr:ACP S-malonyltransferase [Alkalinema sp. FACHB-956]MBD2325579.1 ACP S-malonyltransferase [Alkalinema sp. FACHB-956]
MTKTAWVFPGQGSQAVGMGIDLLDIPAAKARFEAASEILGWSVIDRIQGDEAELSRTLYTQPCLYIVETILADRLKLAGEKPHLVAGHSLGEYSALYAAGVFSFETGLQLIQTRSQLMDSASDGQMAALLGFNREQLETAIGQTEGVVLANDNNDGQVVISGTPAAVDAVIASVKCKRAVKLNVSGAFHSPLMADAAAKFNQALDAIAFQDATVPVLSNTDPTPSTDGAVLKDRLSKQMTGSVRWREISLQLPEEGITRVVEVGPGKVLVGIIKRTCGDLTFSTVGTAEDLAATALA